MCLQSPPNKIFHNLSVDVCNFPPLSTLIQHCAGETGVSLNLFGLESYAHENQNPMTTSSGRKVTRSDRREREREKRRLQCPLCSAFKAEGYFKNTFHINSYALSGMVAYPISPQIIVRFQLCSTIMTIHTVGQRHQQKVQEPLYKYCGRLRVLHNSCHSLVSTKH